MLHILFPCSVCFLFCTVSESFYVIQYLLGLRFGTGKLDFDNLVWKSELVVLLFVGL